MEVGGVERELIDEILLSVWAWTNMKVFAARKQVTSHYHTTIARRQCTPGKMPTAARHRSRPVYHIILCRAQQQRQTTHKNTTTVVTGTRRTIEVLR